MNPSSNGSLALFSCFEMARLDLTLDQPHFEAFIDDQLRQDPRFLGREDLIGCWPISISPKQRQMLRLAANLDEGDGWVNWSGLATLISADDKAIADLVRRLLP
jgi:hypothetical protein